MGISLFVPENFPQVRGVEVHDVTHNLDLAGPHALRGLPSSLLRRSENSHGAATPEDRDGLAVLFYFVQKSGAFGFKLSRVHDPFLHGALMISESIWSSDHMAVSEQQTILRGLPQ